ncbi:oxidoreductase NAD-binding domain containing protein [Nitzschia inconspicua]|uniref:Oxidoreductase NAD-binding domain containing protein n=1 Tax=Nitzschia inconspicua TaxID=303405 RepID=A0A9K3KTQ7_9STRA|nr:oxidoreductase NAD-binding domain containing protein [Nitzschia inconspicua]
MKRPITTFLLLLAGSDAFSPSSLSLGIIQRTIQRGTGTRLFANAPQYDKQNAILERVEEVGKDNFLLHIKVNEDTPLDYEPGNVLALEIQPPSKVQFQEEDDNTFFVMTEKTQNDLEANDGWMRGPYTVSRCGSNSFDILIKRVGYKSNVMATASVNTPVRFGGKFKVPIVEGILTHLQREDVPSTKRVVMISTGVGIGPCIGASEVLLQSTDTFDGPIELLASFRTPEEIAMKEDLDRLAEKYPMRFHWKPIITSQQGRLSGSVDTLEALLKPQKDNICSVQNTHYHLIGNGQLVNEWKTGLEQAGVPSERVTVEAYFNHMGTANKTAVQNIATVVQNLAVSQAEVALQK